MAEEPQLFININYWFNLLNLIISFYFISVQTKPNRLCVFTVSEKVIRFLWTQMSPEPEPHRARPNRTAGLPAAPSMQWGCGGTYWNFFRTGLFRFTSKSSGLQRHDTHTSHSRTRPDRTGSAAWQTPHRPTEPRQEKPDLEVLPPPDQNSITEKTKMEEEQDETKPQGGLVGSERFETFLTPELMWKHLNWTWNRRVYAAERHEEEEEDEEYSPEDFLLSLQRAGGTRERTHRTEERKRRKRRRNH